MANYVKPPPPPAVGATPHNFSPKLSRGCPNNDRQFYLDVLKSNECACGREKPPRYAFCGRCYHSLPGDMMLAISFLKLGQGFENAYEDAVKYLEEEGIIN
jgi:hypothetical protein